MNILILDDDIIAVEGVRKAIDRERFGIEQIFSAYRISTAKEILSREKIRIALLDIELPSGSGLDLMEWMDKKEMKCATIILSSHKEFEYAQQALRLEGVEYLLKPVTDEDLNEALEAAVRILKKRGDFPEEEERNVVDKAVRYIQEHMDTLVSREDVANYVNMHPDYLSRVLKKEKGRSLGAYITLLHMERAKELLEYTDIPVGKVAEMVGYTHFSNFSASFKSVYQISPREYRKKGERFED